MYNCKPQFYDIKVGFKGVQIYIGKFCNCFSVHYSDTTFYSFME